MLVHQLDDPSSWPARDRGTRIEEDLPDVRSS